MTIPIYQVDAFTDQLFCGNPAAVCPLTTWLSHEKMQQIAAENNLSETAFFIPGTNGADFDLRWFTPTTEVKLCGHATLATAHVLYQHLGYSAPSVNFETLSGILTVQKTSDGYLMNLPTDWLHPVAPPASLLEALNLLPLEVFQGREDYLVIVESQEQVADLRPDFNKLILLKGRGVIVSAPGKGVDFVSRAFFPNFGIDEDPVTGSAHTTLTPYWAKRLNKNELTARQISARSGSLTCRYLGDRVDLIGKAVTFLKGSFEL